MVDAGHSTPQSNMVMNMGSQGQASSSESGTGSNPVLTTSTVVTNTRAEMHATDRECVGRDLPRKGPLAQLVRAGHS
jgi:hypothetical protein